MDFILIALIGLVAFLLIVFYIMAKSGVNKQRVLVKSKFVPQNAFEFFNKFVVQLASTSFVKQPDDIIASDGGRRSLTYNVMEIGPRGQLQINAIKTYWSIFTIDKKAHYKIEVEFSDSVTDVVITKVNISLMEYELQNLLDTFIAQIFLKVVDAETTASKKVAAAIDTKNVLSGMIKVHGSLNISDAAAHVSMDPKQVKTLIYALVGEGKITGSFTDDNTFKVNSDVDTFIAALDTQFALWKGKGTGKGK